MIARALAVAEAALPSRCPSRPPPPKPSAGAIGVETIGMTKSFGSFTALEDVSIKVRAGSFHALLGENGAGKSTLVKCIMGFYRPTDGSRAGRRARGRRSPIRATPTRAASAWSTSISR